MSKWFLVLSLHKIKQSDSVLLKHVWFGPCNSLGFFQTWCSSRFSADAHRHQVYLDCRSSRLVSGLFTPWALAHRHLSLGCEFDYSVTQHSPLCTNCFWWELLDTFYDPFMYSYVCYADPMERSALKYTRHQLLASLHCWCGAWGDTCGGKLALRAGGRRHHLLLSS